VGSNPTFGTNKDDQNLRWKTEVSLSNSLAGKTATRGRKNKKDHAYYFRKGR
jgi:hypothetical protein